MCSGAATVASSSIARRRKRSLCASPSPAGSAAWPFHRSSRMAFTTGRCSVPPATRAMCTAAATRAPLRWSCCACPKKIIEPSPAFTLQRLASCKLYARYDCGYPSILVGDALYWLDMSNGMLEFDLDGQSISVITGPPMTDDFCHGSIQIIKAEDGVVGLASFSYPSIQIWQRKVNCNGVATWLVCKTVDLHNIIGLPPQLDERDSGMETILGYAEDTNDILIYVHSSVYTVQLKSMQPKKLHETHHVMDYHPFTSFYTPGEDWLLEFYLSLSHCINVVGTQQCLYVIWKRRLTKCVPLSS
ncbi:uncharacterized protein LOC112271167 isoform X1 [Brachypodium distachyon]|uniref:F-box protein AT5G49610-like beta-propeller domain-containing protein n=1 Tax=Brachypodium distachyon TaxID=15368 RepID=A0A0Q3ME73_BRADI|nr:uncharacterized protein LOC112271167 isoform X1 [Brachypodium distachyon]KQK02662.1 hypothetical protein BRADI_2g02920v3 [Brachypodium distachyon]|eukprot:XP_024316005.1 uncharacterized protein LOC112271167 isoform X1 [Brachypodium distachyon]